MRRRTSRSRVLPAFHAAARSSIRSTAHRCGLYVGELIALKPLRKRPRGNARAEQTGHDRHCRQDRSQDAPRPAGNAHAAQRHCVLYRTTREVDNGALLVSTRPSSARPRHCALGIGAMQSTRHRPSAKSLSVAMQPNLRVTAGHCKPPVSPSAIAVQLFRSRP
jgi:hypothetical protein